MPSGQPSVAGSDIRLGMDGGSIDVFASHAGSRYTTVLALQRLSLRSVQIGQTLPAGSTPEQVSLDGGPAHGVQVRDTNRGVEVTAPVTGSGPHRLVVTAG